jgi:hypothetical protein
MKIYGFLLVLAVVGSAGCNTTGVPVEYAAACDKANDDKRVEVVGYFKNTGSAMCSKSGNEPMRCPIEFVDGPNTEKPIRVYIDKGSGNSEIDNPEQKGLKIKDDKGEIVENTQKVKLTADVNVLDSASLTGDSKSAGCYMTAKKIEKAQ